MKILIINGSPRANGATGRILSRIKACLIEMDANVKIEYIDLGKINMMFCTGCHTCYKTGQCYIKEDGIENLSQMISECDGVIFGSPTYASNVSAQFKTLIDRGHFVFEQLLRDKACFSVVTYKNYGGGKAKKVINDLIRFSGGAVSCQYLVKTDCDNKAINKNQSKQIENLCRKFLLKTKQKNPLSLIAKIFIWAVFNVGIKPYVFKNKLQYKGVINKWIQQGIISKGGSVYEQL